MYWFLRLPPYLRSSALCQKWSNGKPDDNVDDGDDQCNESDTYRRRPPLNLVATYVVRVVDTPLHTLRMYQNTMQCTKLATHTDLE